LDYYPRVSKKNVSPRLPLYRNRDKFEIFLEIKKYKKYIRNISKLKTHNYFFYFKIKN
jgi:hypothetical protein